MNTPREDLILMVQLQKLYDGISEDLRKRQTPPAEVKELEAANRTRLAELKELEATVETSEEELRELHKTAEEWRLELEHFQKQKSQVTNEREFTAVISEIDYATKALDEATTKYLELQASVDEMKTEIESRRGARPEEEEAHKQITENWEKTKEDLKLKVHEKALQAKSIEDRLHPKNRSNFLRLLSSKNRVAISAVVENSCAVCHFNLRPHLEQRVRRCEEIITCEHCHRILYLPEKVAEMAADQG